MNVADFFVVDKQLFFLHNQNKSMKITVYTTTNCQFSKTEKEYLNGNKFAFEEKNLDTNKEFLTEMMTIGNNFAGTPVTKIEKDDGTIVVLKGFTKDEFDATLGLKTESPTPEVKPKENKPPVPGVIAQSKPPVIQSSTPSPTPFKSEVPPMPPVAPPKTEDKPLNDVLSKLQTNIGEASAATTAAATPPPPVQSPEPVPSVPTVQPPTPPSESPSLPDFPAK